MGRGWRRGSDDEEVPWRWPERIGDYWRLAACVRQKVRCERDGLDAVKRGDDAVDDWEGAVREHRRVQT